MKTALNLGLPVILAQLGLLAPLPTHAAESASTHDSVVQITADERGLLAVPYTNLPGRGGTYWEVLPGGITAPLPAPDFDATLPIYSIATNIYLVDATDGELLVNPRQAAGLSQTAALTAAADEEATKVANLISQVQTAEVQANAVALASRTTVSSGLSATSASSGVSDDGRMQPQSGVPYLTLAPTGTNEFLITVFNNTEPANYELWYTPVLANPTWTAVTAGTPGETNFVVSMGSYYTGFFRAYQDTNAIPLWEAANPTNQSLGVLSVCIDSPTNGSSLTQ